MASFSARGRVASATCSTRHGNSSRTAAVRQSAFSARFAVSFLRFRGRVHPKALQASCSSRMRSRGQGSAVKIGPSLSRTGIFFLIKKTRRRSSRGRLRFGGRAAFPALQPFPAPPADTAGTVLVIWWQLSSMTPTASVGFNSPPAPASDCPWRSSPTDLRGLEGSVHGDVSKTRHHHSVFDRQRGSRPANPPLMAGTVHAQFRSVPATRMAIGLPVQCFSSC